jgi:hypothetical protein
VAWQFLAIRPMKPLTAPFIPLPGQQGLRLADRADAGVDRRDAAGQRKFIATKQPATFRIRLPVDGSRDRFEFDRGEVRSCARRVDGVGRGSPA